MLWFIIVGIIAGWLAGLIMKGDGYGLLGDLVLGIIGAAVGGWLFSHCVAPPGDGLLGSIVVATIGAVIVVFVVRLLKKA